METTAPEEGKVQDPPVLVKPTVPPLALTPVDENGITAAPTQATEVANIPIVWPRGVVPKNVLLQEISSSDLGNIPPPQRELLEQYSRGEAIKPKYNGQLCQAMKLWWEKNIGDFTTYTDKAKREQVLYQRYLNLQVKASQQMGKDKEDGGKKSSERAPIWVKPVEVKFSPALYLLQALQDDRSDLPEEVQQTIGKLTRGKRISKEEGNAFSIARQKWWQKKYGFSYGDKSAREEVLRKKYTLSESTRTLQNDFLSAHRENDEQKLASIKKQYQDIYSNQLEEVEVLFGIRDILLKQQFLDQKKASAFSRNCSPPKRDDRVSISPNPFSPKTRDR